MIALRPAKVGDALMLYEWQSDPSTRRYARNPEIPSFPDHMHWLVKVLADPKRDLSVIEDDGMPVGSLRLDHGDETEVSIVIAPQARRKGYGKAALALLEGPVVAEVLPGNEASHALFKGWKREGETRYVLE